ncbi:efflux transporter outer membrane subunit [uncultured Ramlibacter sp.]|uniref:efflux transporter outer membrane subunit n=1 Tax=uncultured Ramlibacter sp. TaxID=260755 RepID=UPI002618C921|nr:efflux transporter outer membrane subunit [uncultured Ramlibacter sp.]
MPLFRLSTVVLALALAGCAVGPDYKGAPAVDTPAAFKQGQGEWVAAAPADALERGPWWQLFNDPGLNALAQRVEVNNNSIAAAVAGYTQARAVTAEQRASLFPSVSLDGSGTRAGGRGDTPEATGYRLGIGASWEPDVFGRLRRTVQGTSAGEQASQADLAAVRLAIQGELAVNYFKLRLADLQRGITRDTIAGYERAYQIASNRYTAGIAARTDQLQAQTQLTNARADLLILDRVRAQLEHAIAVLVGQSPANFALAPQEGWQPFVPALPLSLPSTLLQRRPDIASAERRVAQANEQIGVAISGYYPSFRLSGAAGTGAASIGDLFNASALVWSLGASLAQTIFDAGATGARVDQRRAAFEQVSANYRQTVLTAFKDVEDQLVATRLLALQLALRQQAGAAADLVEQQVLNRYQAGQVNYTEVITAQATAANTRRSILEAQVDRQTAAVALIQSVGGGWTGIETN